MLNLEDVKDHLRVDGDHDNSVISGMIDAAVAAVGDYLNAPEPLGPTAPAPVKAAALLLVGDLYANRELQQGQPLTMNKTYERLLNPYRVQVL